MFRSLITNLFFSAWKVYNVLDCSAKWAYVISSGILAWSKMRRRDTAISRRKTRAVSHCFPHYDTWYSVKQWFVTVTWTFLACTFEWFEQRSRICPSLHILARQLKVVESISFVLPFTPRLQPLSNSTHFLQWAPSSLFLSLTHCFANFLLVAKPESHRFRTASRFFSSLRQNIG